MSRAEIRSTESSPPRHLAGPGPRNRSPLSVTLHCHAFPLPHRSMHRTRTEVCGPHRRRVLRIARCVPYVKAPASRRGKTPQGGHPFGWPPCGRWRWGHAGVTTRCHRGVTRWRRGVLLDLDRGAGRREGVLGLLRGFLGGLLQDGLRSAVHEVLGLLQTQRGQLAHDLDDLDLLLAGAGEDDVELVLLLGGLGDGGSATGGGDRDRGGGGDVELVLERLHELGELDEGQSLELGEQFVLAELGRHDGGPSTNSAGAGVYMSAGVRSGPRRPAPSSVRAEVRRTRSGGGQSASRITRHRPALPRPRPSWPEAPPRCGRTSRGAPGRARQSGTAWPSWHPPAWRAEPLGTQGPRAS